MDGYLTIGTDIDDSGFDAQISQLENKINDLKATLELADNDKSLFTDTEVVNMRAEVEKLTSKLDKLKSKQASLASKDWDLLKGKVDSIGNSISNTVSKMGRWVFAVFSLRSAYSGIRQLMSTITQYDDQMNIDMQYMRYAMAMAFKPILEKIVSLAYRLLVYVNMIAKAWFGVDLFKKASANNFTNALDKSQKKAEKLKKTLAGFDTANVLSDTSNDSSNSSNIGVPSFDLSAPENEPIPDWLGFILENKDLILNTLTAIGLIIVAWKVAEFLSNFKSVGVLLDLVSKGLVGLLKNMTLIKGIGIALIIYGIVLLIQDVINWLKNPTWEGFGKILVDIGIVLAGLALVIGGIPLAIAAIVTVIVGLIITNWDKIKNVLGQVGSWIMKNVINPTVNFFKYMGQQLWQVIKEPVDSVKRYIGGITSAVKQVWSGIRQILNGDIKGGLQTIFKGIVNVVITSINFMIDGLNTFIAPLRSLIVAIGNVTGKRWTMSNIRIPRIHYLKSGGIVDVPKTGVPLASNVIAGEAGPEAVLPLNDENMERIAKYIARYITINLDLTGVIDKRQLFRIIKQIIAEDNFARNGG